VQKSLNVNGHVSANEKAKLQGQTFYTFEGKKYKVQ